MIPSPFVQKFVIFIFILHYNDEVKKGVLFNVTLFELSNPDE